MSRKWAHNVGLGAWLFRVAYCPQIHPASGLCRIPFHLYANHSVFVHSFVALGCFHLLVIMTNAAAHMCSNTCLDRAVGCCGHGLGSRSRDPPHVHFMIAFGGLPPRSASFRAPASSPHQDPVSAGPCQHLRPAVLAALLMGVRWCPLVVLTWICL